MHFYALFFPDHKILSIVNVLCIADAIIYMYKRPVWVYVCVHTYMRAYFYFVAGSKTALM